MKNQLTTEHIEEYRENGFLAIEGFLDPGELSEWQRCTQEAVNQRLESSVGQGFAHSLNNQADPDAYYAQVFTQCLKLLETHAGMRKLLLDLRLGEMAA